METAAAKETAGPESYSMTRISEFKLGDENFAMLLFAVEEYMGEPLGSSALQRIAYFYDTLKLPADLIEYLVGYCVQKGHKSMRYIEKLLPAGQKPELLPSNRQSLKQQTTI